ncbi:hypothetical protein JZ751_026688 [Albula glossodonta]|uniref:Uncharacterized protein n=1 Tax=Albula glossodonta TaxID=121402 RepID=A0A8T2PCQ9_9TELE|nr:hypothetical protein JZ751_026688 [Albula glossodonta]
MRRSHCLSNPGFHLRSPGQSTSGQDLIPPSTSFSLFAKSFVIVKMASSQQEPSPSDRTGGP